MSQIHKIEKSIADKQILKTRQLLSDFDLTNTLSRSDYQRLFALCIQVSSLQDGIKIAKKFVENFSEDPKAYECLAYAYLYARKNQKAIDTCKLIIDKWNNDSKFYSMAGYCSSSIGDFENAEKFFIDALTINRSDSKAVFGLAKAKKHKDGYEQTIALFKRALTTPNKLNELEKSDIYYSIAKVFNDAELYEEAWKYATNANVLRYMLAPFEIAKPGFEQQVRRVKEVYKKCTEQSGSDKQHILIVGMPRSGTTLLESIICRDGKFFPGGESPSIEFAISCLEKGKNLTSQFDENELLAMAGYYEDYYRELEWKESQVIVNKVPLNAFHVGLFLSMFPKGKIIHAVRDLKDVVTSVYFESFAPSMNFSSRIDDIEYMYEQTNNIMDYWKTKYPSSILTIEYEDFVKNKNAHINKLAGFLNADKDLLVRDEDVQNVVETPSLWQVRQKIYKNAVSRYRRYPELRKRYDSILNSKA